LAALAFSFDDTSLIGWSLDGPAADTIDAKLLSISLDAWSDLFVLD
jgi:hypothetical protein